MTIKVRTCRTAAEYRDALGAIGEYGTWDPTDDDRKRFRRYLPLDRMHAAFDGKRASAAQAPSSTRCPSRAAPLPVQASRSSASTRRTSVAAILTAMMRAQLDDAHERGDEIAMLWASDERIYGRYGYGLASLVGEIELPRDHAGFAGNAGSTGTRRLSSTWRRRGR